MEAGQGLLREINGQAGAAGVVGLLEAILGRSHGPGFGQQQRLVQIDHTAREFLRAADGKRSLLAGFPKGRAWLRG
jgi:hypothetical protein